MVQPLVPSVVPRICNRFGLFLANILLAAACVVSGKLGLLLALPSGYACAIFPPVGTLYAPVKSELLVWFSDLANKKVFYDSIGSGAGAAFHWRFRDA